MGTDLAWGRKWSPGISGSTKLLDITTTAFPHSLGPVRTLYMKSLNARNGGFSMFKWSSQSIRVSRLDTS
jgi:hypothetical protein